MTAEETVDAVCDAISRSTCGEAELYELLMSEAEGWRMRLAELEEYVEWVDSLTWLDRSNFERLVTLPNAMEIVDKMDEGKYRDMAIFAMAMVQALKKEQTVGKD